MWGDGLAALSAAVATRITIGRCGRSTTRSRRTIASSFWFTSAYHASIRSFGIWSFFSCRMTSGYEVAVKPFSLATMGASAAMAARVSMNSSIPRWISTCGSMSMPTLVKVNA